jgi:hypothetical protein
MSLIRGRIIRGHRLLIGFVLFALTMLGQPAMPSDSQTLCWHDYPIPAASVNYEKALASETLVPDRISVNGKVVNLGITENNLNSILGLTSTVVEDWRHRTDQQQCEHLLELLHKHPDSMHLYKLGQLKWKKMSGLFRVSEWQIPDAGTLRAFFYKPSADKSETSYLYHLTLLPTSLDKIQRKKGKGYLLIRIGASKIEWDVQTNRISISRRAEGG